jgi:putative ABC transport system substrate-binding protein
VDQQNAQGDQSNLKSIAARFKGDKPDLICAIATPAAQAVANDIHDIPIVGIAVTDYVQAKLVQSNEKPGGNVTGASDMNPVNRQIDMALQLMPGAKKVGLLYNSSEVNSEVQGREMKKYAAEKGLTVVEKTVSSVNDIQQAAESMTGQIDFLYVPTDNILASSMPTLLKMTDAARIPVIAGAESMVKDGALASLSVDYYQLGVQAGAMAAKILKGEVQASALPVETQQNLIVVINKKNADLLGISIPEEIAGKARFE